MERERYIDVLLLVEREREKKVLKFGSVLKRRGVGFPRGLNYTGIGNDSHADGNRRSLS